MWTDNKIHQNRIVINNVSYKNILEIAGIAEYVCI